MEELNERYGQCPQYETPNGFVVGGTWDDYDKTVGNKPQKKAAEAKQTPTTETAEEPKKKGGRPKKNA